MNTKSPKNFYTMFAEDRYPYQAAVALGEGAALKIRYRAAGKVQEAEVKDYLKSKLAELGFDPEVALRASQGIAPTDAEALAYGEACAALGELAAEKIAEAMTLAEGYSLSRLIGAWSFLDGSEEIPIEQAPGAETCAVLPADVQKAIAALAAQAQAPAEPLDFFGPSPRS